MFFCLLSTLQGFEPQIMKIVEGIRPDRQTVLFSATFPKQVELLAKKVLRAPVEIIVGGRSTVSNTVDQHVEVWRDDQKFPRLLELLGLWCVFVTAFCSLFFFCLIQFFALVRASVGSLKLAFLHKS